MNPDSSGFMMHDCAKLKLGNPVTDLAAIKKLEVCYGVLKQ